MLIDCVTYPLALAVIAGACTFLPFRFRRVGWL